MISGRLVTLRRTSIGPPDKIKETQAATPLAWQYSYLDIVREYKSVSQAVRVPIAPLGESWIGIDNHTLQPKSL